MPLNRQQKSDQVEWISNVLEGNEVLVVMENKGLTVAAVSKLRNEMRAAGGGIKVVKNRLARIALQGRPGGDATSALFAGPTVIAYSADPVTAPKVITNFVKDNDKLVVLGGLMGETAMDAKGIEALSKMPSREEIIASIVGCVMAPGANLVSAITAPATNLASITKTLAEREDA
ncbi:50S ribosomal protein L10 [Parvularcula sp. LCG005]|uniref:50S ribosomal protein L10 n=1 Tax=Parvularcula sp. LCG005 TaxID=3078805 RepID=UPI0029428EFC|nr:50S ribosomal protein L10 [Parvularcula sp. LCG005]WOI54451.1 50S ribosomal protein L10 [Parvularcula sp. LCG005]